MYTLEPSVSAAPKIWTGFVKPAWPLFADDTLVKSNAVFGGVVEDQWVGKVASVSSQCHAVFLSQLRLDRDIADRTFCGVVGDHVSRYITSDGVSRF